MLLSIRGREEDGVERAVTRNLAYVVFIIVMHRCLFGSSYSLLSSRKYELKVVEAAPLNILGTRTGGGICY